ncbi:MAG: hypothetical protein H6625_08285 [Bdellovibrionaceae bacterium]|nr:hypothetical protein [Pseudobdellovibrionaceae bacterium]
MKKVIVLFFILISTIILACGQESNSDSQILIPPIAISCSQASSVDCVSTKAGKKFYVGLLANTQLVCEEELLKAQSSNFYMFFDYSGSGTAVFNGELEAEVLDWNDTENQEAFYLNKTNYKACAFLDVNDNGKLDPTEVIGELTFSYSNNQPTIIDWY